MHALSFFTRYYGVQTVMTTASATSLVIGLKNYRRHKELRVFTYLLLFDLIQVASTFYYYMHWKQLQGWMVQIVTTLAYILFESVVCTRFICSQLIYPKAKLAISLLPILVAIESVLVLIVKTMDQFQQMAVVDCVTLTIPCMLYFYQLFTHPSIRSLKTDPAFWIITGLLLLKCGSLPLWMSRGLSDAVSAAISSLNFILYTVFFAMVGKAFLCVPAAKEDATGAQMQTQLAGRREISNL